LLYNATVDKEQPGKVCSDAINITNSFRSGLRPGGALAYKVFGKKKLMFLVWFSKKFFAFRYGDPWLKCGIRMTWDRLQPVLVHESLQDFSYY